MNSFIFKKSFGHIHFPRIKFLGKRSLLNSTSSSDTMSMNTTSTYTTNSPIIVMDLSNALPYQPLSNEEIETVNNGGPMKVFNWREIKLKL